MANEQTGGLPLADITKVNLYGMPDDRQKELLDANDAGLAALQQRYANPNWFNVAAGFFKPQLGGFAASLGSASQALGENLEKQRANELPVAQMRAQNAIMRNQFGQNQKANQLLAGANGVITPDLVREMEARVGKDHPTVLAAKDTLATQQKTQEIAQGAQNLALQRLKTAIENNILPTAQMYKDAGFEPPAGAAPVAGAAGAAGAGAAGAGAAGAAPVAGAAGEITAPPAPPAPTSTPNVLGVKALPNAKPDDASWAAQVSPEFAKAYSLATASLPDYLSGDPEKLSEQGKAAVSAFRAAQERAKEDLMGLSKEAARHGAVPSVGTAAATNAVVAPTPTSTTPSAQKALPYAYKPLDRTDLQTLSPVLQQQAMENRLKTAAGQEDISTSNLAPLAPYAGPVGTQILNQSKAIEKAIASNPKAASQVYNVLGQGDVMAQILKTAEAGLQFNGGVLSGSLSIPTSVWQNAKLPPELWSYANDLVTHSLILQSAKARAAGQNITKIPVAEYLGQQNATANLHQPWDSALHSVRNDILDAWHQRNIYNTVVAEKQKVAPGELAPTTAVMQHSPAYKKAMADWEQEVADLNSEREKGRKLPK